jgi:cellulose synthase/poly-beta-1,6-N-acetylglucosamine synthase-like glycosyltransferase
VTDALVIASLLVAAYFAVFNLLTLILLGMSYGETAWLVRGRQPRRGGLRPVARRPGISVVVPAYNEEDIVVTTASALLEQDYAPLEVVVVDDGSTDATFERLHAAFDLVELPVGSGLPLQAAPLRSLHMSRHALGLRVVRKANGGRADALNVGLGVARHELVAVTDADSLLEPDALIRALRPFEEHPDECLAVGGSIRVANRSRISHGHLDLPRIGRGVEAMQMLEYVRGFLGTRIAWSRLNGLAIVSGAFGLFRRETLIGLGGFQSGSLGEDMELTLRLHHRLRPGWLDARIVFAADAICWTQAPSTLSGLRGQRIRWQVGLLETVRAHAAMLGRRRYGATGILTMPYLALFEAIAPIFELGGYAISIILLIIEPSAWPWVASMLLVTVLFGQVQTMMALLVQETAFHGYSRRDLTRLIGWSLFECLWYHPLLAVWRTGGTVRLLIGRRPGWGEIPRQSLGDAPLDAVSPLTR